MDSKKAEIRKLIDDENGVNFHRNIDLSGYVFFKGKDFISFKIVDVNGTNVVAIKYIYLTNKHNLIKLLSFCIDFWAGNNCKAIYFLEHARAANYCKKYFKTIGFEVIEEERTNIWKYEYTSNNGYKENEIREYFL